MRRVGIALALVVLFLSHLAPQIKVLNSQSYPEIGGKWVVHFNTSGKATLKIKPIKGTSWEKDLEFLGVYCGNRIVKSSVENDTIVVKNYQCKENGKEVSKVISKGRHNLEFSFGKAKKQAHNLASYLKMEWGTVNSLSTSWVRVNLTNTYESPVVVSSPDYTSVDIPVVTRLRNVSADYFEIKLQNPGDLATPASRDVHYIVIEEGNWTLPDGRSIEAKKYNSTQTDSDADWTPVAQTYQASYTQPVVVGQVMTHNDSRWSVFWASDGVAGNPPSSTSLYTGKHVAEDTVITRNYEEIGYIVSEEGHGTISGVEYDFFLSSDTIQGMDNSPPFAVLMNSSFSSTPSIGVASSAGMNGGNGGWPVLFTPSLNATHAFLATEEDTIGDTERSHIAEQAAAFIFSQSGSFVDNLAGNIQNYQFNTSQVNDTYPIRLTVNVTDSKGPNTTWVKATFKYPTGEKENVSLIQSTYPKWTYDWKNTTYPGQYNVTDIYTYDGEGYSYISLSNLSFYSLDTKPLYWQENSTNTTIAGWAVKHRVFWTDNSNLSGYIFSWSNGGNWSFSNTSSDLESSTVSKSGTNSKTFLTNTQGESGEVILAAGVTSKLVKLNNSYNLSKSFIVARHHAAATPTTSNVVPDVHTGTVRFVNDSYIKVDRYSGTTYDSQATWSILQADNLKVWNFTHNWASGDTLGTVDLSPALPTNYQNKCFVELWRNTRVNSTNGECFATAQIEANITNTTGVSLQRDTESANCATPPVGETIGYVVCFNDNTTVQTNELLFSSSSTTDTIQTVNLSNSWLTFNFRVNNNGLQQVSMRGNITANNQVTFTKGTTTGTVNLRYYTIEFTGGQGLVQRQGGNVLYSATQQDWTFSNSYSENNTLAICSENFNGGTGTAFPRVWWTGYWFNSNTIRQNRGRVGASSQSSDHVCQAVQWPSLARRVDVDIENTTDWTLYNSVMDNDFVYIKKVNFTVGVSGYSNKGSTNNGNLNPDLQLYAYNGTDWVEVGNFSILGSGNHTLSTTLNSITKSWMNKSNRNVKIRGVNFDYFNSTDFDQINWTGFWVGIDSESEFLNDSWKPFLGTGNWSNTTKVINSTENAQIKWIVYANDSINFWNSTSVFTYNALVDSNPPKWSNLNYYYPAVYSPTELSQFNVTWQDELLDVSMVYFESNFSGTPKNYTMKFLGNLYTYNGSLPAGTHYWKSWANDTLNQWNVTDTQVFTINKANPAVNTLLNYTDNNYSVGYYTNIDLRVELGITGVVYLYVDGSQTDSGVAPLTVTKSFSTLGKHNITGTYLGSQNYTSGLETHWLSVWGESKVNWLSPINQKGTPGDLVNLFCNVSDSTTQSVISNYPVKFWANSTNLMGENFTNSSGVAKYTWDTSGYKPGTYNPKCVITDNSTLFYNDSAQNQDSTSFTLVSMNTPTLQIDSTDLVIGKNNPNDNATATCSVSCSGGNCEGLQVGLQYDNSGVWDWISSTNLLINHTNPKTCGTASSCTDTWDIMGLFNSSFPIRCNASSTFPVDSQINVGSNSIDIVVGQLSIDSWVPITDPLDLSIYDTFTIDPIINCTSPPNAKAGCGDVFMYARTNQTSFLANDLINSTTDIKLESGSAYQTYQSVFPSQDGGYYEVPFSAILTNMTVGGNGEIKSYDVKVNSSDANVTSIDPQDRSVIGHTGQISISVYNTTTSNDKSFEIKYNITCSIYRCLNVSIWPRFNKTSSFADTLAPTSINPTAYNVSIQPYSKFDIQAGQSLIDQIINAWSSVNAGSWKIDVLANSSYSETSQINSTDASLDITLIRIKSNLTQLLPQEILENENSTATGYCNCTGGTCTGSSINIEYFSGSSWMNIPTDNSNGLKTNTSSYSIGSLTGTSQNYSFNITGRMGGNYPIRVSCQSNEDVSGSTNITLSVNDYPDFNNSAVNTSIFYKGQEAKFSIDIKDEAGIAWANFTIEGVNHSAIQGSGDQWYYLWTCTSSNPSIDWTTVFANDTEGYFNQTDVANSTECDAQKPDVSNPTINDTSIVNIGTPVHVNATITDPEGNLDTVVLEVNRPTSYDYNVTPNKVGNVYSYNFTLDEEGLWRFTFYANDTGNQVNGTLALDGNSNQFINALDIENPVVSNPEVNVTITKGGIKLNVSATDNVAVNTVIFTVNGTNYTNSGNSGKDWYYVWSCTQSNYYLFESAWVNDTSDNSDVIYSVDIPFYCDIDAPTYLGEGQNNSNPGEGEVVKMYALWDNLYAQLSMATLKTNQTGIMKDQQYHVFSTKPEWSNFSFDTTGKVGQTICWKIFANNSLKTLNSSMPQHCFTVKDITPPTFSSESDDSGGSVAEGVIVNTTALWDDDLNLDTAILQTDIGGWHNESYKVFSATPDYSDFSINTSGYPNKTICWKIFANDSTGNLNSTMNPSCFYVEDVTIPTFSLEGDDSNGEVEAGSQVLTHAFWDDDVSLDTAKFRTNQTGTWTVKSYNKFSTTPDWSNFSIDTTGSGAEYICWNIWANDTSGNTNPNMNNQCFYVNDTVLPKWENNQTTPTVANADITHSTYWTDTGGLKSYIFSFDNCTNTFVNDTSVSISGTSGWINVTKHSNSTIGCTIRWQVFTSDKKGNWNNTPIFSYVTLENAAPKWSDNSTNATLAGWAVKHSVLLQDDTGLSGYVFAFHNGSNLTMKNNTPNLENSFNFTAEDIKAEARHTVSSEKFDFLTTQGTSVFRPIGRTINTSNAFMLIYSAGPSSTPDNWMVTGYIFNSTHVLLERSSSTSNAYVSWFVVDVPYTSPYESEFSTQRGVVTLLAGTTLNNATINPVNTSRSIVLGSCRVASGATTADTQDGYATFELFNSTMVLVKRASTATGLSDTCRFEVVEFSNTSRVKVQTGETTLSSTNPQSVSVSSFNTSSSWLYHTWDASSNGLQQVSVYGEVLDGNTIRFGRYSSTSYTNRIRWYLVEYLEGAKTVYDNYNWDPSASGTNNKDNTISPAVNKSRTMIIHSSSTSGTGTAFARNKNLPYFYDISNPGDNWRETQYYGTTANQDQHETRSELVTLPYLNAKDADNETNKTAKKYLDVLTGSLYEWIKNITVTVNVTVYNNSGSVSRTNNNPDLWLELYNGTNWVDVGNFSITSTGNFSLSMPNFNSWTNESNRDLRIKGVYFDYNGNSLKDKISYEGLWVKIDSEREFVNDSWVALSGKKGWANVTKVINSTIGSKIQWNVYVNDTLNNWNSTPIFHYNSKEDSNPPKWFFNSTNDTTIGEVVGHDVYWQDDYSLSGYIFSFDNCTGNLVNDSWVALSGTSTWINVSKRVNNTYNCQVRWQVWVNDSWGNLWNFTPEFSYFTTYTANLQVLEITLNNTSPKEGEAVLITANISNLGPTIANNSVVFFNSTDDNLIDYDYGLINENFSVGYKTVSKVVNFTQGTHIINVSVWPAKNVLDRDYSNNWNDTNVTIPIWSYFYGNASGSLGLAAPNESFDFYLWNPQSLSGNVFIVDYDSGVDFFDMWPLNSSNDLSELDLALGTENYTDSVEKTYDADGNGTADNFASFDVYGIPINGVPVVNATDGSPFYVGLLWDRKDGGIEYDGTQDVAFITELNPQTLGAFGIVDYESKAPSNLKNLKGSLNLIATRMEVR